MLVLASAGLLIEAGFVGMAFLRHLMQQTIPYLALNGLAYLSYGAAVYWTVRGSDRRRLLPLILGLAVLFRVTMLFITPPSLSGDVYRYIWDGHLVNAGVNPYAHAIDSPLLDRFDSSLRTLVDHSWMASPYLPTAQVFFAVVYRLAPDSPLAFQVAAAALDLLTGLLVLDLLRRVGLPRASALIYLWNPLVIVEFAHGAHADALMNCLMMLSLWALIAARSRFASVVSLVAATLTKGLPVLLLPVVVRRWGWRRTVLYGGLLVAICLPFAFGAGWGLRGPLDGEGLFGAMRIYAARWNYNGGIYHWLEVLLSGYQTPGAVPPEIVGWQPIWAAKLIVTTSLGLVLIAVWRRAQHLDDDLALLRLAVIPLAAYLLLATTVHPWYVTLIIPVLPFLASRKGETSRAGRFLLPGLAFSAVVSLSYLTYLDLANLRETHTVRLLEYVPLYLMLIWSAWPTSAVAGDPGTN